MAEYNGVLMQFFHWYISPDQSLWKELYSKSDELSEAGFTAVWLPPAYKGSSGGFDVGYGVYDLFDLGEFDQKGSIPTKYGTKEEYIKAIESLHKNKIQVYADIVFNHKLGGDHEEEFMATPFNPENRNEPIGEMQKIKAWTNYTFDGRNGKYSTLKWNWWHFNACDHNAFNSDFNAVYLFEGKRFDNSVDLEKGNFDYLMGCNLDINNEDVQNELKYWGEWYLKTTKVDGFRFDAVKHVKSEFFIDWIKHLKSKFKKDLFAVGEYWSHHKEALKHFIEETDEYMMLFDASLHFSFAQASKQNENFDLTKIFDNSLVAERPDLAVTIVSNHDTQPLQALESVVEAWFKPLAYGLILLRRDGYPCVFYPDYYGAEYKDKGRDGNDYEITMPSHKFLIDKFLYARKHYAFGEQYDYFDHANCIGWTRVGDEKNKTSLAVILSNGDDGVKRMQTSLKNHTFTDITEHIDEKITTDEEGWAEFKCNAKSISVWIS
jgi:alpha-amylase